DGERSAAALARHTSAAARLGGRASTALYDAAASIGRSAAILPGGARRCRLANTLPHGIAHLSARTRTARERVPAAVVQRTARDAGAQARLRNARFERSVTARVGPAGLARR